MRPDIETLKAWCHWKRKENPPIDEDTADLVKAVEDCISQVGNWKAKFESAMEQLATYRESHGQELERVVDLTRKLAACEDRINKVNNMASEQLDALHEKLAVCERARDEWKKTSDRQEEVRKVLRQGLEELLVKQSAIDAQNKKYESALLEIRNQACICNGINPHHKLTLKMGWLITRCDEALKRD